MTTPNVETWQQRLQRMALDVQSGTRTLAQIRASADRLAGRPVGDYSNVDDSQWLSDPARLQERLTSIFTNRGIALEGSAPAPQMPASPGTPVPAPPAPTYDPGDARDDRDAIARLNQVLDQYGLTSLSGQVERWLVEGISESEVPQRMRETQEFKTRFPGIEARQKAGFTPPSVEDYLQFEQRASEMMRQAGLPAGFYDSTDDFSRFISNGVSLAELGDRITLAANAAFRAPKETLDALAAWGVGPGELTAYWLDPDKAAPLLEKRQAAAELAGTAQRTRYGTLNEDDATRLAGLGVTGKQAETGFQQLNDGKELFASLDSTEDRIGQQEQLGAVFEGNSAARRRIEQRAKKRAATFAGSGGFASSQQGLVGLGDAN